MTRSLKIAAELSLPIEAVTQKFAFLGKTGSGKTYAATKMAELMLSAGAQVVALDPVGVWYGLRLSSDGKGKGIEIPVFGGLYGDIPLESGAGALIADVIVDRGISAVIDVSQFEHDTDKARFVTDFAGRLFFRKKAAPSALHLYLEEAQEFLPQNTQRGEERMLHAMTRITKVGRNYGFGLSIVSQRPQEINKKALNLTEVVFAFQTNGVHERKSIADWVKEKGEDVNVVEILPKLKVGYAHAWSPSWLEISEVVHVEPKKTFNASATPKVGDLAVEKKPLAPIDIEKLRSDMASTIEKSKADDPKLLRKRVAELEAELRKRQPAAASKAVIDQGAIERAVAAARRQWTNDLRTIVGGELKTLQKKSAEARDAAIRADGCVESLAKILSSGASVKPSELLARTEHGRNPSTSVVSQSSASSSTAPAGKQAGDSRERPASSSFSQGDVAAVPKGLGKRILDSLAALEQLQVEKPDRAQLAAFADSTPGNGHFKNTLGELNASGLVFYPEPGYVQLTESGRAIADVAQAPTSLSELHQQFRRRLSGLALKILEAALTAYPSDMTRDELALAIDSTAGNGHFKNTLGDLRTLGVIHYPQPGRVRATDVLFPEGLN